MSTRIQDALPLQPGRYQICIKEEISENWISWFDEFEITRAESDETLLVGLITDQSALHGVLAKIRDLNLTLISINFIRPTEEPLWKSDLLNEK